MTEIIVRVHDSRFDDTRELTLPGNSWPLTMGSGPDCSVKLLEASVPELLARIERIGNHNMVTQLSDAGLKRRGQPLAVNTPERFDELPLQIGPFSVTVHY